MGIALTFGLVVMAMIYTLGDVSGAHLNPAVTFGFWISGRLPGRKLAGYVLSQCLGAIAASALLSVLFSGTGAHNTCGIGLGGTGVGGAGISAAAVGGIVPVENSLGAAHPSGGIWESFVLEIVLTGMLMFVILGVSTGAKEKGLAAGVAVGGVVALAALLGGPISGASLNPARSLGPAVVTGQFRALWIYLIAPFLGALIGVGACRCVREAGCCSPGATRCAEERL